MKRAETSYKEGDLQSENAILRDLVQRLNKQLSQYQEKYPDAHLESLGRQSPTVKEWSASVQPVKPLLVAYDARVKELQQQINRLKTELDAVNAEKKTIEHEKDRVKMYGVDVGAAKTEWTEATFDRVRVLSDENDALLERMHLMGTEFTRAQEENAHLKHEVLALTHRLEETETRLSNATQLADGVNEMKKAFEGEIERINREANLMDLENGRLREDVDSMKSKLESVNSQLLEARKTALDLTLAYKNGIKDIEQFAAKENSMIDEMKHLGSQSDYYSSLYRQCAFELEMLQNERADMVATMKQMEQELIDYETRMVDYEKQLSKAVDKERQAVMEYEQAKIREDQLEKDIKRLENRIDNLKRSQEEFINSEIEKYKHHYAEEKKKLTDEWTAAMFQKTELQLQMERAIREKRIAEAEAKKMRDLVPIELERLQGTMDELQTRIRRSDNERNDAVHALESLQLKFNRETNRFECDKKQLAEELNLLTLRNRNLEKDIDQAKEERLSLFNKLQECLRKLDQEVQSCEEVRLNSKNEMDQNTRKIDFQKKEFERKSSQDAAIIEKLSKEIQELLAQQQKMASKWKDEARTSARNFERIIDELTLKLEKTEGRLNESTQRYLQLNIMKDDAMKQLETFKRNHAKMHDLLSNAEARATSSSQQVKVLLSREQEMINELKLLQRSVDQLTLENKRIQRQNKVSDKRFNIGLSDVLMMRKPHKSESGNRKMNKKLSNIEAFSAASVTPSEIGTVETETKENQELDINSSASALEHEDEHSAVTIESVLQEGLTEKLLDESESIVV